MKIAALLAVVGVAGAAQAQSATWMADVSANDGDTTAKVTLSLEMAADAPFVALSATIFDTLNTAGAEFGSITGWQVLNQLADLTGDLTTSDGDSLFGTNAGQLTVFGPFTSANPIDVLSFSWEAAPGFSIGAGDAVSYQTATEAMVLWVGDDKESAVSMDAEALDVAFGWEVVPTPASMALLGLGGLALVRRRR
jgi:uncharacterized protein (TIGR03382 family)